MTEETNAVKMPHSLILQERRDLSVSGVLEVLSFDETMVVMSTTLGELTVHGAHLHISKTNVETGELVLDGELSDFAYSVQRAPKSGGVFSRIFG